MCVSRKICLSWTKGHIFSRPLEPIQISSDGSGTVGGLESNTKEMPVVRVHQTPGENLGKNSAHQVFVWILASSFSCFCRFETRLERFVSVNVPSKADVSSDLAACKVSEIEIIEDGWRRRAKD
jgi:hypothetical protein